MITQIDPKTALVVIDLQKGIVNLPLVHPVEAIINNSIKLIRAFRSKNLPVVIVKVNPLGASWTQTRVDEPSAPKSEDQIIQARTTMQLAGFFVHCTGTRDQARRYFHYQNHLGGFLSYGIA